ncbi:hypothetical protein H0H81_010237 [Sphagnurus paluster]|uniref:Uncharacterized protein n=1 Tax=Sphagnurus paluster TaxID=117069 RepID=A0A9P7FV98_9AGAR|nr:hypothetical protein H0H81_010237 [Sphagnurus paluster]
MSSVVSSLGVAIVTGASKGIGRAIALRLAKDGYDVGINDLPAAEESLDTLRKEIFTLGRRPFVSVGDVSVPKNVENMISSVVDNLGQLDVMVANAGIAKAGPLIDTKISDWHELFSINAFGVFLSYQYAAKQMIKQGTGGRIIGASSIAGKRGELHLGAYSATKFAVRGLTQVAGEYCDFLDATIVVTFLFKLKSGVDME